MNRHFIGINRKTDITSNMKLIIALCLVAAAVAAPPPSARVDYPTNTVALLNLKNDFDGRGNYGYGYEQSDGQRQEQQGELRNEGREDEYLVVKGSYGWVGPDGVTYLVTYTADEDGFKPEIEQGPGGGVPPAVVASLLG